MRLFVTHLDKCNNDSSTYKCNRETHSMINILCEHLRINLAFMPGIKMKIDPSEKWKISCDFCQLSMFETSMDMKRCRRIGVYMYTKFNYELFFCRQYVDDTVYWCCWNEDLFFRLAKNSFPNSALLCVIYFCNVYFRHILKKRDCFSCEKNYKYYTSGSMVSEKRCTYDFVCYLLGFEIKKISQYISGNAQLNSFL